MTPDQRRNAIQKVMNKKYILYESQNDQPHQGLKKLFFTTSHDLFLSNHYMDYDHHNITGILAPF